MRYFLLIGSVLIILILGSYLLFASSNPSSTTNQAPSGSGLPVASSTSQGEGSFYSGSSGTTVSTGTTSVPTMTVAARGTGQAIIVDDFIHNGVTSPDVENLGNYYLAGSSGYCTKSGVCPSGASTTNFIITYDSNEQFFTIALTKEPIGQARLDAQQFLLNALGLPEAEMCNLNYYLGTDYRTNSFYTGTNLGFSFCPGATELP